LTCEECTVFDSKVICPGDSAHVADKDKITGNCV
jgi:hypothetical protein